MSSSGPVSRLLAFGARDRLIESGLTIFTHHCWPSADLAAALGHLHDRNHPEVHAMIRKLLASITAAGKPAGILDVGNPEQAKMWLDEGFTFVAVDYDLSILAREADRILKIFKPED